MAIINIANNGASPGNPDNLLSIQKSLDIAEPGDTVYVPPGDFKFSVTPVSDRIGIGLQPRSGTTLKLDGNLKAIPNALIESHLVRVSNVENVTILGPGAIIGERAGHLTQTIDRNGGNIYIVASENIVLGGGLGLNASWSDGVMVIASKKVSMDKVLCNNNCRNGLSIISVENMRVTGCVFTNTTSVDPMPQAGIDIEPNLASEKLLDVWISGNSFINNKGAGVYVAFDPSPIKTRVYVVDNVFNQHYKDGNGPPIRGVNSVLANFLFAACRWMPGYDWWGFPTSYSES